MPMLKKALLGMTLGSMVAVATPALAEDYTIDSLGMHASITFRVSHFGFSFITGSFDTFKGQFSFDEADPSASSVSVSIDPASVNTNHIARDAHLRSSEFFDVRNHPTATFESTTIEVTGEDTANIAGILTIRGVTKEVTLVAQHIAGGPDPWGGFRRGFTATVEITPADFGMPHTIADTPVLLTLDVEGIRQ